MADTSLLERTLQETVPLNKARGNFVAKFLVALLQLKSVNLSEIANVFALARHSRVALQAHPTLSSLL